ncbi:hypothetical protein Rrhod_4353 [Rhodococcus rhodnii LMG 5362]|uniref:Uncharacterized protein n=1 Tax=Rhodococcus rhodnii LMG 5362 TaxID=1273125 RepID=R7WGW6_9NOCA|nr:hypothetical protein Rrhod_4353 [Rhodococcus rhodnii LMG 5362]
MILSRGESDCTAWTLDTDSRFPDRKTCDTTAKVG